MNAQFLKSVVWKEYRVLRPIWLSMLAITVVMQLLVLVSFDLSNNDIQLRGDPVAWWLFGVALTMSAMYALGCTAALFSAEREEGTHDFLMLRGMSPRKLVAQKAGFGLLSTALLLFIVWCTAAEFAGRRFPSPEAQTTLWNIIGLSILEVFAWGTLFSLLLKQPLRAAVLAITAAAVTVQLLPYVFRVPLSEHQFFSHYLSVVPERICVLLVLISIDIWIAGRWFDRPWISMSHAAVVPSRTKSRHSLAMSQSRWLAPTGMFGRLLWQQWHQTKGTTIAIGAGATLLLVLVLSDILDLVGTAWQFSLVCAALFGACAFLPDKQQQGYRFMVTHAVSPNLLWLSRQFVGLGYAILVSGILLAIAVSFAWIRSSVNTAQTLALEPRSLFVGLCGIILAFATGQLCSLLFRGNLLAVFFGLVISQMLVVWALLMGAIDADWWWSVAPLPVAFWLATWLRTPAWLLERKGWRSWLPVALALGIPILAILVAVPSFRVYQIPLREPGFSVSEFSQPITPEEKTTADMYRRAGELIGPMPKSGEPAPDEETEQDQPELWQPPRLTKREIEWVKQNKPAIRLALEASSREACVFDDRYSGDPYLFSFSNALELARLLTYSARTKQGEGKLDEAFDRYLAILRMANHTRNRGTQWEWWCTNNSIDRKAYRYLPSWAAAEGQTSERIRTAIAEIKRVWAEEPSLADAHKTEYIIMNRLLTADTRTVGDFELDTASQRELILGVYLLPWELARARRLMSHLTSSALSAVEDATKAQPDDQKPKATCATSYWEDYLPWIQTTFLIGGSHRGVMPMDPGSLISQMEYHTAVRRATVTLMALAGWYGEHGMLPETLDDLVGPYFEELPLDPYTGETFHYRPEGFPTPIRFGIPNEPIPADWPLLWSPGADQARVVQVGTDASGNAIYKPQRGARSYYGDSHETSEHNHYGIAFPLPTLLSARDSAQQ